MNKIQNNYENTYFLKGDIMNRLHILFLYIISFLLTCSFTTVHPQDKKATDEEILHLYGGLRVADVVDGLDMIGLRDVTIMDQQIEALWKDVNDMSHHLIGIAVTARYIPTSRIVKNPMEREEFKEWEGKWYNELSDEPFVEFIKEGTVLVLDVAGDGDTGSVGSFNSLAWKSRGNRGIVSNGGIRDTDEIILQRIPVYLEHQNRGRGIRPGRNEIESVNKPVSVGGVLVNPGDVIVADGDGVVVVPREQAEEVAHYAWEIITNDIDARRSLYEELGIPPDHTVEPPQRRK